MREVRRGSLVDETGDVLDSGPPVEVATDGRLTRAPLLRTPGYSMALTFQSPEDWSTVQEALHLAAVRYQGGSREDDLAAICRCFLEVVQ